MLLQALGQSPSAALIFLMLLHVAMGHHDLRLAAHKTMSTHLCTCTNAQALAVRYTAAKMVARNFGEIIRSFAFAWLVTGQQNLLYVAEDLKILIAEDNKMIISLISF